MGNDGYNASYTASYHSHKPHLHSHGHREVPWGTAVQCLRLSRVT